MYYKRFRGKSIVCFGSDSDVLVLLDEYFLRYIIVRKRFGRYIMYLVVDLEDEGMVIFFNFIAC